MVNSKELKARREALRLTQTKLAEMLGVTANTIARWERSERGIPSMLTLALETIERQCKDPRRSAAGTRKKAAAEGRKKN